MTTDFRSRLRRGDMLIGSFVKTPSPHIVEIFGQVGLDFAVLDQEHAPLDIAAADMMALAGRAAGLPLMVRRWGQGTDWIPPLLDLGLSGVMKPHVLNAADTNDLCDAVRFSRGKRGLSPSPRAGQYGGLGIDGFREASDATCVAVAQIEDQSALQHLDAICAVKDLDMIFIGPADLSQSLGVPVGSNELVSAVDQILAACTRNNVRAGIFVADATKIPAFHEKGASVFVCGSDQAMLRKSAEHLKSTLQELNAGKQP